ncbi:hypothetical protein CDAR_171371 [Caerostris darwini]|uniref:Uncharacterized protein n=1 Tax=Caerostris darwini TaxID=1538125 RepID=A0AAV4WM01_9ARAC|nr:hypothetical protein CDAR_171371 [Caerostris darwini]
MACTFQPLIPAKQLHLTKISGIIWVTAIYGWLLMINVHHRNPPDFGTVGDREIFIRNTNMIDSPIISSLYGRTLDCVNLERFQVFDFLGFSQFDGRNLSSRSGMFGKAQLLNLRYIIRTVPQTDFNEIGFSDQKCISFVATAIYGWLLMINAHQAIETRPTLAHLATVKFSFGIPTYWIQLSLAHFTDGPWTGISNIILIFHQSLKCTYVSSPEFSGFEMDGDILSRRTLTNDYNSIPSQRIPSPNPFKLKHTSSNPLLQRIVEKCFIMAMACTFQPPIPAKQLH